MSDGYLSEHEFHSDVEFDEHTEDHPVEHEYEVSNDDDSHDTPIYTTVAPNETSVETSDASYKPKSQTGKKKKKSHKKKKVVGDDAEHHDSEVDVDTVLDNVDHLNDDHMNDPSEETDTKFKPKKSKAKKKSIKVGKGRVPHTHINVVSLNSMVKLKNFTSNMANYIVLLYHPQVPSSVQTEFAFVALAKHIHPTNKDHQYVPVTLAKFDVSKELGKQLRQDTDFFKTPEEYDTMVKHWPAIIIRSGMDQEFRIIADQEGQGFSHQALLPLCASCFQDPSLQPFTDDIEQLMSNNDPKFIFLYSENDVSCPRFIANYPPVAQMMDVREGNIQLQRWFLEHPEIASEGLAISVLKMDRPDLRVATVIDLEDEKENCFRFVAKWLAKYENA